VEVDVEEALKEGHLYKIWNYDANCHVLFPVDVNLVAAAHMDEDVLALYKSTQVGAGWAGLYSWQLGQPGAIVSSSPVWMQQACMALHASGLQSSMAYVWPFTCIRVPTVTTAVPQPAQGAAHTGSWCTGGSASEVVLPPAAWCCRCRTIQLTCRLR
jgi:hypothetical protein